MIDINNGKAALFEELKRLEVELHAHGTRRNRKRMDALLHPDFFEYGRSGSRHTREDILAEFETNATLTPVHAQHFDLTTLADGAVLLTYLSAHVDTEGTLHRLTLRSSVWVRTDSSWKMRFHQGTPTTGAALAGTTPMAAAPTPG